MQPRCPDWLHPGWSLVRTAALLAHVAWSPLLLHALSGVVASDRSTWSLPKDNGSPKKWMPRTPAMATGITDHVWTMGEFLLFRVPPWRQDATLAKVGYWLAVLDPVPDRVQHCLVIVMGDSSPREAGK
ncbi:MAG: hypothetical protein GY832_07820 [Chloroflexi bacterium]|nr:hypothetical protein [Chloroflexota bacterium]